MQEAQNNAFHANALINCGGKLVDLSTPQVMGILNVTPDSFYDGGQLSSVDSLLHRAEKHLNAGARFLDLGAASSRPGAVEISEDEELERLLPALKSLRSHFQDAIISVDTWRASVSKAAVDMGANMINDISGGMMDSQMHQCIAQLKVPYIIMHMQGTPSTMQVAPAYENVTTSVYEFLLQQWLDLKSLGVADVIIDPGFGFGKTLEHNYALLRNLDKLSLMGPPVLVGFSRKRMINEVIETKPTEALNGTSVLNTLALTKGASILRVHDVKEAVEAVKLWEQAR